MTKKTAKPPKKKTRNKMRTFENGNWDKYAKGDKKTVCPICKTNKPGKVVLIPIVGTQEDGNAQAEQVHLDCLDPWFDKQNRFIYQKLK